MSNEAEDLQALKDALALCLPMLRLQRTSLLALAETCSSVVAKQPRAVEYATCAADAFGVVEALDKLSASMVRAVDRSEMLHAEGS